MNSFIQQTTVLFGQTHSSKVITLVFNLVFMLAAFGCIGIFAYFKLIPDATTGVLTGIIIRYFFKKNK